MKHSPVAIPFFILATVACWTFPPCCAAGEDQPDKPWFDRRAKWNEYDQFHFKLADRAAYIVAPKQAAAGRPWIWRARFPGYHSEMDIALLAKGYHLAYVDVAGMFGSPAAVRIGDAFYEFVTSKRQLSSKPVLEGVSRGGLFVYNWAAKNPDKVACIYCDTPVCDFKSWPGGQGGGLGSEAAWKQCQKAYGLTADQAKTYKNNPIDQAKPIAVAKIPILHIVSENDRVVPPKENTYLLEARLKQHGHAMEVISVAVGTAKSNGHHFDHPSPKRVVQFIEKHTQAVDTSRQQVLRDAKRIVFLGDSITYAGHYVAFFDAWLATRPWEQHPLVINVGLPSETVSGLSEDGHAGGRFPRPDLAERLQRVLAATDPDLVFACYGINCGIYQPFDAERFRRYQSGVEKLKKQVEAAGASLILITPPTYDDQRAKKSFSYNPVLDRYAEWLLSKREQGWRVVSLHKPMASELAKRRASNPQFTFQPDAVHPNEAGHWFMAQTLIGHFGDQQSANAKTPEEMLSERGLPVKRLTTIRQRLNVRRNAYLAAAGHKRPGIKGGLPIEQAEQKARELTEAIRAESSKNR